jgi:hypothetical protein
VVLSTALAPRGHSARSQGARLRAHAAERRREADVCRRGHAIERLPLEGSHLLQRARVAHSATSCARSSRCCSGCRAAGWSSWATRVNTIRKCSASWRGVIRARCGESSSATWAIDAGALSHGIRRPRSRGVAAVQRSGAAAESPSRMTVVGSGFSRTITQSRSPAHTPTGALCRRRCTCPVC